MAEPDAMIAAILRRTGTARPTLLLDAMPRRGQAGDAAAEWLGDRIVFHGRLDDRATLIATLGEDMAPAECADAMLVLRAYRAFGAGCLQHLRGDFAFALWDERHHLLFCARDRFGAGALFFHDRPDRFLCALHPHDLLASGEVSRATDEAVMIGLLGGDPPPVGRTVHAAIHELPAAHMLRVTAAGVRIERYWEVPLPATMPHADAPERLSALLDRAVADRLRGPGRIGTLLSGGLDSSTITAFAARRRAGSGQPPLPSFTLVYDRFPDRSERPWAEAVLRDSRTEPHFVAAEDVSPFADMPDLLDAAGGPFLGPNFATTRRLHRHAAAHGVAVLLDGHGGDEVIWTGAGRLTELAQAGHWRPLIGELRALAAAEGKPAWPLVLAYVRHFLLPAGVRRVLAAAERRVRRAPRDHATVSRSFLDPGAVALLAPIAPRLPPGTPRPHEDRVLHHDILRDRLQPYALGLLTRMAAANGITLRYPFWDAELIAFCLSLPAEEKLAGGWTRLALRRATAGLLPDEVRWRRQKFDFLSHLVRNMVGDAALIEQALHDDRGGIGRFAALPAVRAAWARLRAGTADGYDVQGVWRTVMTALWLDGAGRPQITAPVQSPALAATAG